MTSTPLFEIQAQTGMKAALDHAVRVAPSWANAAYDFLCEFAAYNAEFISEDVSDQTKGMASFRQPPSDRAWGVVYRRAAKAGIIAMSDRTGKSRRRHGSVCPLWKSLVYRYATPSAPTPSPSLAYREIEIPIHAEYPACS
jgi:hypothetical protein